MGGRHLLWPVLKVEVGSGYNDIWGSAWSVLKSCTHFRDYDRWRRSEMKTSTVWNEDVDLVCPGKRCLLVTFQVAEEPFAASGNWEDQKVCGWVSGLFLDRKSLLIFPNEPHLFPIAFSKCYPCSILVSPSYDKNVNIIIIAILLLYFRLNLALLHHKHVGFACSGAWGLIPFLPLADCKLVILPSLVSIPSSANWKSCFVLSISQGFYVSYKSAL